MNFLNVINKDLWTIIWFFSEKKDYHTFFCVWKHFNFAEFFLKLSKIMVFLFFKQNVFVGKDLNHFTKQASHLFQNYFCSLERGTIFTPHTGSFFYHTWGENGMISINPSRFKDNNSVRFPYWNLKKFFLRWVTISER